jgi:hypothetical protein
MMGTRVTGRLRGFMEGWFSALDWTGLSTPVIRPRAVTQIRADLANRRRRLTP